MAVPSRIDELKVLDLVPSYEEPTFEQRDVPVIVHDELAGLLIELHGGGWLAGYLAGALLCRYDHPAADCQVMGAEIDRRLASS